MKYTNSEAIRKIRETGEQITRISESHKRAYNELLKDVHHYVSNSDVTYLEVFSEIKSIAKTREEFNNPMQRMRDTIYNRNKGK